MDKLYVKRLLDIYSSFAVQKDYEQLLQTILKEIMDITRCDGGTLYIRDENDLHVKYVVVKSLDLFENNAESGIFPPIGLNSKNVCEYSMLEHTLDDGCTPCETENTENPLSNYEIQSMLVVPMEDDFSEISGVLQLINALDKDNNVIEFGEEVHEYALSIAAQAAICLSNMNYEKENILLLNSIVQVMSTAIDERSPFNANHTRNMARYGNDFIDWLKDNNKEIQLTEQDKNQFIMSIWLHDIGKLTTPENILNKESRLNERYEVVILRIENFILTNKVAFLEEKISEKEYNRAVRSLNNLKNLIQTANRADFLTQEHIQSIEKFGTRELLSPKGIYESVLTKQELESLLVPKGTLTDSQRAVMQNHVVMTAKMLENIKFSRDYKDVPLWANSHHEYINGSGYPHGYAGEKLCIPIRILTILDIYEALVASDRPYKSSMTPKQAFFILYSMVDEGKIDKRLLDLFKESEVWKNNHE